MRRTLRLLLALSSTLAFMGIMAPNASALHDFTLATHHQGLPTNDLTPSMSIDGVCAVEGAVALHNAPVLTTGEHPNHGFFEFTAVSINCVDLHNTATSPVNLSGNFAVDAHGDADGPFHTGFTLHGETAEGTGWSHGGHYLGSNALCDAPTALDPTMIPAGEGCGFITATRNIPDAPPVGSTSTQNYVKFMRSGGSVEAWGHIDWLAAAFLDVCFNADLEFAPAMFHPGTLSDPPNPAGNVLTATLTGTATLLLVADHHCG